MGGWGEQWAYYKLQIQPHRDRMAYLKANEPPELTEAEQRAEAASVRYITPAGNRHIADRMQASARDGGAKDATSDGGGTVQT